MVGWGMVHVLTALLWLLCLPIVVLVIGFAGSKLWSVQAIIEELSNGALMGVAIRLAVILYIICPVVWMRRRLSRR
jgi:hypothetical protein